MINQKVVPATDEVQDKPEATTESEKPVEDATPEPGVDMNGEL